MKYFDVVANRRASLWRDVKAETTKIQNRKWNSDLLGDITSSNVKIGAKPLHV